MIWYYKLVVALLCVSVAAFGVFKIRTIFLEHRYKRSLKRAEQNYTQCIYEAKNWRESAECVKQLQKERLKNEAFNY